MVPVMVTRPWGVVEPEGEVPGARAMVAVTGSQ